MTLRIIGAGIGRTGTTSLKVALEKLLGAPCYHMHEVISRPQDVPLWHAAAEGRMPDWHALFDGYAAAVDWPASSFWPEIHAAFPDAKIILSERDSEAWWRSMSNTIVPATLSADNDWRRMIDALFKSRFISAIEDKNACIAAYEANNVRVRATAPASHLVTWRAEQGWGPICAALDLLVPDEPFPHVNTTSDFKEWQSQRNQPPKSAGDQ
ncbi:MAG: sulfotransferase [Pseudomonadota bacterium]|nr:sulfotransferase [Pseudomonadota bacterium]